MDKRIEFEMAEELPQNANYLTSNSDYMYINDCNQFNYAGGVAEFSNLSVVSPSTDQLLLWSEAYVVIPHEVVLTLNNNVYFGTAAIVTGNITPEISPENSAALAPKSSHHLVDSVTVKMSGFSINQPNSYVNIYANEKLKEMPSDKLKILSDVIGHRFDSADSLCIPSYGNCLETNNSTFCDTSGKHFPFGNNPNSYLNTGHIDRVKMNNYDLTGLNSYSNYLTNDNSCFFNPTTADNCLQTGLIEHTTTQLRYRFLSVVPLSLVSDFYKNLPALLSTNKFNLRMVLNCAKQNSWTTSYDATSVRNGLDKIIKETDYSSIQPIGSSCPYLLSTMCRANLPVAAVAAVGAIQPGYDVGGTLAVPNPNTAGTAIDINPLTVVQSRAIGFPVAAVPKVDSTSLGTGLVCFSETQNVFTVTVKPQIGWSSSSPACRIYVPKVKLNPMYQSIIMKNNMRKIEYEEFYTTELVNIKPTDKVSIQLPIQLSCVRKLLILPYFSGIVNTLGQSVVQAPIYQSLLSSAPTTTSPSRCKNFQVQIGGTNIFAEQLNFNYDYYINNILPMTSLNGANSKADIWSSNISYSDWQKAYTCYSFDMKRVETPEADQMLKSFQLSFTNDTSKYLTNFIVMVTYQKFVTMDVVTGEIQA